MYSKKELLDYTHGNNALIISPSNTYYIAEYESSFCYILVTEDKDYFLTDSRYVTEAREHIPNMEVIECTGYNAYEIMRNLATTKTIYFDEDIMLSEYNDLQRELAEFELSPLGSIILEMRAIKSDREIECIIRAQNIAEQAFEKLLLDVKEDVTEQDLVANLEYYMKRLGGEVLSFDTIVAFGTNGDTPHAHPGNRKLKSGDFVTIDFGTTINGYHGDMTRTFAFGKPTDEMKRVYNIVRDAQRMAIDEAMAGKRCDYIDSIARNYIRDNGYGEYFGHGLGHSVGIEIHEDPRFSPSCDYVLRENNVITVEPGIYIPKKFGIRIEDIIIIKDNKQIDINNLTRELIIL